MRGERDGSGNIVVGPVLVVVAVLCLWGNEGRFDYYRAARQTSPASTVADAPPQEAVSYTDGLRECLIDGEYVRQFEGYYRVSVSAEINSWVRTKDEDGDVHWSKKWNETLQSNDRNSGLTQQLHSKAYGLPSYQLGDLQIDSARLHFADAYTTIDPANLQLSDAGRSLGLKQEGDYLYLRKSGSVDELGDERLHFRGIPTKATATYFGSIAQSKGVGKQYEYKRGFISALIKNDGMLHHLVNGTRTEALKTVKSDFRKLKWTVRLLGTVAIIIGLLILLSQFLHFIIAIPLIGQLASLGVWLFSISLGLTISLVTIVSSMVYHNPWTALIGLGLVAALVVGLLLLRNQARSNARERLESTSGLQEADTASSEGEQKDSTWDSEEGLKKSYSNLVRLAMIDGKLEESENNYLVNWGRSKGLTDHAIVDLFDQAKRDSENGLEATRFEDIYPLISLAMIDGYLSVKELNHIVNFGEQLGMNRAQVNAVVTRVRKGEYQPPMVS